MRGVVGIIDKERARRIAKIVLREYSVDPGWAKGYNLFELLVAIILSQRTHWKNTRRALERFKARYRGPEEVAASSVEEIAETIKPAGLYREKSLIIKRLAEEIVSGRLVLNELIELPYERAREKLLSIKGVGLKTADVFLMFAAKQPVVPVDTHINRIARRTGIVDDKAGYEDIRRVFEEAVPQEQRGKLHLALIMFGRSICRPRNPKCDICPVRNYCKYWLEKNG